MTFSTPAMALLAALIATSAAASPETTDSRQDASQAQRDQNGDASAHGYQNPTGPDPDPRMTEQVGEEVLEQDDEHDDARNNGHKTQGSERR
jgi:hypothetical protein